MSFAPQTNIASHLEQHAEFAAPADWESVGPSWSAADHVGATCIESAWDGSEPPVVVLVQVRNDSTHTVWATLLDVAPLAPPASGDGSVRIPSGESYTFEAYGHGKRAVPVAGHMAHIYGHASGASVRVTMRMAAQ